MGSWLYLFCFVPGSERRRFSAGLRSTFCRPSRIGRAAPCPTSYCWLFKLVSLTVANAYREILLGQEGAFGTHLLEHDFTEPSIMFGKKGLLSATPHAKTPGLTSVPLDPNG